MPGLFISYRRSDSAGWAGRLKDHLENRYGEALVWQDVDDIRPGASWLDEILTAIRSADAALVIIGPRWLELGRSRLTEPGDVLRQEIEGALGSTAPVIPVLVGGASIPAELDLPPSLHPLPGRQAISLLDSDWHRGVQLLVESLQEWLRKPETSVPLTELRANLSNMQQEFFSLLETQPPRALDVAREALAILDRELPHHPQDVFLQELRAYFHKNQALALNALGDPAAGEQALARAERAFRVLRDELEANVAGVYNGIGSVQAMRGNLDDALQWIDRALALVPDYPAALHDRALVLRAWAAERGRSSPKGKTRSKPRAPRRSK